MDTGKLTKSALFVALGIVVPIGFHMFGLGKAFLPMHIPVLLCGALLGYWPGLVVGLVTPVLSGVLTGMPPMIPPIAQSMVVELGVYGFLVGLCYHRFKMNIIASLLISMFGGRLVYGILAYMFLPLFGIPQISVLYPVTIGVMSSIPGIAVQIAIIPLITSKLSKSSKFSLTK